VSKAKKKRGKKTGHYCMHRDCGETLRVKDKKCPGCGRGLLFTPKAGVPWLVKSENVVPFHRGGWACWSGHLNKAGTGRCAACGEHRATTDAEFTARIAKAARPGGTTRLGEGFAGEADPGKREGLRKSITEKAGGKTAEVVRAYGGWDGVQYQAIYNDDPSVREYCRNLLRGGAA
jgi:hypothetical protein